MSSSGEESGDSVDHLSRSLDQLSRSLVDHYCPIELAPHDDPYARLVVKPATKSGKNAGTSSSRMRTDIIDRVRSKLAAVDWAEAKAATNVRRRSEGSILPSSGKKCETAEPSVTSRKFIATFPEMVKLSSPPAEIADIPQEVMSLMPYSSSVEVHKAPVSIAASLDASITDLTASIGSSETSESLTRSGSCYLSRQESMELECLIFDKPAAVRRAKSSASLKIGESAIDDPSGDIDSVEYFADVMWEIFEAVVSVNLSSLRLDWAEGQSKKMKKELVGWVRNNQEYLTNQKHQ